MKTSARANFLARTHDQNVAHARIRPRDWVLSTAAALLLAAAQAPWSFDLLAWVALVPLFLALEGKGAWRRLPLGLWCGAVWSCAVVGPWLAPALTAALPVGTVFGGALTFAAAEVFGGFYLALFAWLCRPVLARRPRAGILGAAALWVVVELLRSHALGGIPWGLLGHSQWRRISVIQVADLGGVLAVSFVLAAVNVAVFVVVTALRDRGGWRAVVRPLLIGTVLLAVTFSYAAWRRARPVPAVSDFPVQIVYSAWRSEDGDAAALLRHMVDLASSAAPDGARLMIWPENSLRFYIQQDAEKAAVVGDLARERGQYLLAGGPRFRRTFAGVWYFNAVHLFTPDGALAASRDKRMLVPLAEARLGPLPSVERPFRRGRSWRPIRVGEVRLGVLICFEAIFPGPARRLVRRGAAALINVTNDQLVGAGAEQQAAMAVFRAVENRVPLARVSNLGPTLVVDRLGRIASERTGEGAFVTRLPARAPAAPTVYARYGDRLALLLLGPALWMILARTSRAN